MMENVVCTSFDFSVCLFRWAFKRETKQIQIKLLSDLTEPGDEMMLSIVNQLCFHSIFQIGYSLSMWWGPEPIPEPALPTLH